MTVITGGAPAAYAFRLGSRLCERVLSATTAEKDFRTENSHLHFSVLQMLASEHATVHDVLVLVRECDLFHQKSRRTRSANANIFP